jgi:hypothetical protein
MIGQMFVQVYPDPACSKMHGHFAEAYLAASGERPREMAEHGRSMAAVA